MFKFACYFDIPNICLTFIIICFRVIVFQIFTIFGKRMLHYCFRDKQPTVFGDHCGTHRSVERVFNLTFISRRTKNDTHRRILIRAFVITVQRFKIQIKFANKFGFKINRLQFNGNQTLQGTMIEKKVDAFLLSSHNNLVFRIYEKEIFGKEGRKGCYSSQSAMPAKFLSPYWGVWCTAHARYRLLEMVYKIDEDVVYCDTDSIYMVNYDKHADDIKAWNDYIRVANQTWVNNTNAKRVQDNATAINQFQSDNNATPAQVKEFVFSQKWWVPYENFEDLGEFDKLNKQGDYTRFKVMGAKRYIKESWDYKSDKDKEEPDQLKYHFEQTIAGLPKGVLSKYATKLGKSPFEMFSNEMVIPKEYSAKNGHVYNDEPHYDTITDEFGNTETMVSDSSVGIYPTSFSMTMTSDFLELIETVKLSRPIDYERGEYL